MLTRRDLGRRFSLVAAGLAMGGEAAFAQRRSVHGHDPSQLVLLNANENPDGPPQISLDAMSRVLARSGRYHDEDTDQLTGAIASAEKLRSDQVLVGCGSSEILHCAIDAFTSPALPLIDDEALDKFLQEPAKVERLPVPPAEYRREFQRMIVSAFLHQHAA